MNRRPEGYMIVSPYTQYGQNFEPRDIGTPVSVAPDGTARYSVSYQVLPKPGNVNYVLYIAPYWTMPDGTRIYGNGDSSSAGTQYIATVPRTVGAAW